MKLINGKKKPTKLGKILRLTKIDELPQLLNILKNDMSLIGPRPLYLDFNSYYSRKHKLRIYIKPGLTGLAQIKVRDSTDWFKKFNFDYIYVKKANINLDLYILFKTFVIVFVGLSFALVALLVMCFLQLRRTVLMPPELVEGFDYTRPACIAASTF